MNTYYCVYGQANNWWRVSANCRRGNEFPAICHSVSFAPSAPPSAPPPSPPPSPPPPSSPPPPFSPAIGFQFTHRDDLAAWYDNTGAALCSAPSWASGSSSSRGWIAQCYRQEHGGTLAVLRNAADQAAAVSAIAEGLQGATTANILAVVTFVGGTRDPDNGADQPWYWEYERHVDPANPDSADPYSHRVCFSEADASGLYPASDGTGAVPYANWADCAAGSTTILVTMSESSCPTTGPIASTARHVALARPRGAPTAQRRL